MSKNSMRNWLIALLLLTASQAQAANKFWSPNVGGANANPNCNNGTYAWDADSGTGGLGHSCWVTATGGGTATTVPGAADIAIFDASSGGGTVNVNLASSVTLNGITCGAFTGTLDFSVSNTSFTLTASGGFNCSGAGTRSVNFGTGTFDISAVGGSWTMATTTGLTVLPSGVVTSPIKFTGTQCTGVFGGGALTYVEFHAACPTGGVPAVTGNNTFTTLKIDPGNDIFLTAGSITTVGTLIASTNPAAGGATLQGSANTLATITSGNNQVLNNMSLQYIAFTGAGTWIAHNSINSIKNTGITIDAPRGIGIIGGS